MEQAQAQKESKMQITDKSDLELKIQFLDEWVKETNQYRLEVMGLESMIDDGLSPELEAAATLLLEDRQSLLAIAEPALAAARKAFDHAVEAAKLLGKAS